MEWVCPDCKTPEKILTNPVQVTEGDRFYLCCDKCGTLLRVDITRDVSCPKAADKTPVWGIPRERVRTIGAR